MVSALYQRRALQHPEHFVFGICHVRPSTVAVLAATWVQKAIEPPTGNQNLQGARVTDDHAHAPTANVALESRQSDKDLEPIDLVRLYLVVLAIIPLAKGYQRQLISNPPAMPAPGFKEWAEDETQTSKSRTSDTRASGSKRARVESESPGGDLTGATSPSHTLSLGGSSPEDGVPERKFGDIQRLPEMSSYYKCLHYVQSLPS
ncbi:hypothetical protein FRC10_010341 [Ceratobasidium sp. 414]|nr:hypothetical protein FRC10_010341 [Ceratobasidium sp. 414]